MILNTFDNAKSSGGLNIKISNFKYYTWFNFDATSVAFQIISLNILVDADNAVNYYATPLYTFDMFSNSETYYLRLIDVNSHSVESISLEYKNRRFRAIKTSFESQDIYKVIEFLQ